MKFLQKICVFLLLVRIDARYMEQHRPCSFNFLCTCSNGGPDLGSVCCHNIPFMTVPPEIKNFAIYILSLKYNKLRFLTDNSLNGTGLWKLQINNNLLTDLPPNALAGLEKTLSILDLRDNDLVRVPKEAIQNLEKLYNLNLAGNYITFFQNEDFRSVSKTLKILDLSDNSIIHINNDAFRNMVSLEVLNLAFNAIISLDDITFQSPLNNLRLINLMGNQLHQMPLKALANLKNLKIVNLNENLIPYVSEGREIKNRMNLEELHLENNLIEELTSGSFRLFNEIDRLYLKGNPLRVINDTFANVKISEIYMPHCHLSTISKKAFKSVTQTLKVLDLSYNDLEEFPSLPLKKLIKLSVAGNEIHSIERKDVEAFESTLKYLDIRGPNMKINQDIWKNFTNLRELVLNKQQSNLNVHSLNNISPSMEKLSIVKSSLKTIESGSFQQLAGLKNLDLSHNSISRIANTTFKEIGHSLEKLNLHAALRMQVFPTKALNLLSKLQYLDISRNQIEQIPQGSFTTFQNLKYLNLNHNNIKNLNTNFVSGVNNVNLLEVKLAFNKITSLKFHTFRDLAKLTYLQLNDNLIKKIEKSAFFNLDSLIRIELEGNVIEAIENEAFQNLPNIQFIDLAYNKLSTFNLEAFDQVGRLSTLKIDVDHNKIQNLTSNYTSSYISSNIKCINLKYNNISYIESDYFDPIRISINKLDLSHNSIFNLTNQAFSDMSHLQTLILSYNLINIIEDRELKGLKDLQILNVSHNHLKDLPRRMFEEQNKLRIFSIARNKLKSLPREIFLKTDLEQLDLSFNELDEFPGECLKEVKDTMQFLDLSGNRIQYLNFSHIRQLEHLRQFSLSQNGLHLPSFHDGLKLPQLITLDLSFNNIQNIPHWIFGNLPKSLEELNLAHTGLRSIPILDACNILHLNLSGNFIQSIQTEALEQLKKVQVIDISNNNLQSIYNNQWSNLQQLRSLYLQTNPIQIITNNTFSSMEQLQELFLKNLKLQDIQKDAFHHLTALKMIEMDTYPKLKHINLSELLHKNNVLKEIRLHVQENELDGVLMGPIPKSLKTIILDGGNLKTMAESSLADIQSEDITLDIRNTNITYISQKLFQNMKEVRNITASFKNNKLQKVGRIITEGVPRNLKNLELSGNQIHCSCELAWIWEWIMEYEYENDCYEMGCDNSYLEDLRKVKCFNKDYRSFMNTFKKDMDCFSSATLHTLQLSLIIAVLVLTNFYTSNVI